MGRVVGPVLRPITGVTAADHPNHPVDRRGRDLVIGLVARVVERAFCSAHVFQSVGISRELLTWHHRRRRTVGDRECPVRRL